MGYMAYLLRLWSSEQKEGRRTWRASLESAHGPERHVFDDLQALMAFLEQRTCELERGDLNPEHCPGNQEGEK